MNRFLPRVVPLLMVVAACSDSLPSPTTPSPAPFGSPQQTVFTTDVWDMQDVEADLGGFYSLDTTQAGLAASRHVAPADLLSDERGFCRDHFKPIDLWWDGGYGLTHFHLAPPLLFVAYRQGTYRSPRNLVFRRAIYETIQVAETTDPAGNVWRFQGRFNALCRGGELELGPVVFGGQLLVAQDPVTRPVLVRRGTTGDGCGGSEDDWHYMESYDPYAPAPDEDTIGTTCGGGSGGSGGSAFNPADYSCTWDYITIEITRNGGATWEVYWSGWAQVCEANEA